MSSVSEEVQEQEALRAEIEKLKLENRALHESYQSELHGTLDKERRSIMAQAAQFTAAAANTTSRPLKVDVAKPDNFDGTEFKFSSFIHQLTLLFWANPAQYKLDDNKITCALSYMRGGRAESWARGFMEKLEDLNSYQCSWDEFKDLLTLSFGTADPSASAVDKLYKLEQGSMTADEYIVAFEEHEGHTGWDDKALMNQFERGLKPGLAASIYRLECMPATLPGWKQWCRKLDRQWRLYEEKQRMLHPQKSTATVQAKAVSQVQVPRAVATLNGGYAKQDGTGVIFGGKGQPMDIDGAQSRIVCFRCGNRGHVARFCPDKIRGNVQHVRAVLGEEEFAELLSLVKAEDHKVGSQENFVDSLQ